MEKFQKIVSVSEYSKKLLALAFDTEAGIARFGGKENLYYKSLLQFVDSYHNVPLTGNEAEDKKQIHTVKGVAGNLGINELFEAAKLLETNLSVQEYRDNYFQIFDKVSEIIHMHVEISDKTDIPSNEGSKETLKIELNNLANAIDEFQLDLCENVMSKICNVNWSVVPKIDFAPLAAAIEDYDFLKAKELLLIIQSAL